MKRILHLLLMLTVLSVGMNAQESADKEYCTAIRKLSAAYGRNPCGEIAKELDVKLLTKVAKEVCKGVSGSQCKKLAVIYKEQMLEEDICRSFIMPSFRKKGITVADMEKVTEAISRPEYRAVKRKTEEYTEKTLSVIIQNMMSQSHVVAVDCPESYRAAFNKYMEKTDALADIMSMCNKLKRAASTPSEKFVWDRLGKHLEDNGDAEMLNACYGTITEEELQILTDTESMPERKKIGTAVLDMMEAVISYNDVMLKVLQISYENWLKSMTK